MRFADLPKDWAHRPITDPAILEGVVDLIATDESRAAGSTYVLLCHANQRLLQPIRVPDEPSRREPAELLAGVTALLGDAARHEIRDVVMVIARPGQATPTERDRDLRAAFEGACRNTGFALHAVAVAAPGEVFTLPPDGGCAAA